MEVVMRRSRPSVLWLALCVVLGLVVGSAVTGILCSRLFEYGDVARAIADATIDVAALERLSVNDAQAAVKTLKVRLQGSMMAANANRARLTDSQRAQVEAIEVRSRRLLQKDK
jgi:hypothetical protein